MLVFKFRCRLDLLCRAQVFDRTLRAPLLSQSPPLGHILWQRLRLFMFRSHSLDGRFDPSIDYKDAENRTKKLKLSGEISRLTPYQPLPPPWSSHNHFRRVLRVLQICISLTDWIDPSEEKIPFRLEVVRSHTVVCTSFALLCFEAIELLEAAAFDLEFHGSYVEVENHDSGFNPMDREEKYLIISIARSIEKK